MKIKKLLSAFLALIMVVSCFGIVTVSADGGEPTTNADTLTEVYVKSDGGTDVEAVGAGTISTPVQLHTAWQLLKKDVAGTIYFLDDVQLAPFTYSGLPASKDKNYTYGQVQVEPTHTGTWTYKTANGENGALVLNAASIHISGPVVFDDITIKGETAPTIGGSAGSYAQTKASLGEVNVFCQANNVTFTENFEVGKYYLDVLTTANTEKIPAGWDTTTTKLNVWVGADKTFNVAAGNDFAVTLNGGTFNKVTSGVGQKGGTYDSDITVNINSGVTVAELQLTQVYTGSSTAYVDAIVNGKTNINVTDAQIKVLRYYSSGSVTKYNAIYNNDIVIKAVGNATLPTAAGNIGYNTKAGIAASTDGNGKFFDKDGNELTKYVWYGKGVVIDVSGYDKTDVTEMNAAYDAYARPAGLNITVADSVTTVMQTSAIDAGKLDVRFVAGLRDYTTTDTATFKVVAKKAGTAVKTFTQDVTQAYGSILAGFGAEVKTAADLGANSLIALAITDVPADEEITFEVTTAINGVEGPVSVFKYTPAN